MKHEALCKLGVWKRNPLVLTWLLGNQNDKTEPPYEIPQNKNFLKVVPMATNIQWNSQMWTPWIRTSCIIRTLGYGTDQYCNFVTIYHPLNQAPHHCSRRRGGGGLTRKHTPKRPGILMALFQCRGVGNKRKVWSSWYQSAMFTDSSPRKPRGHPDQQAWHARGSQS